MTTRADPVSPPGAALDARRLRAIVVDVDGTLYRQGPVRRAMLWRLVRGYLAAPRAGVLTVRALQAYRRAQESLRARGEATVDLAQAQLRLACETSGVSGPQVSDCVARWMEREPLDLLGRARRTGVVDFLRATKDRGLRLGVFSDYPATAKLEALGVAALFDVTVSAQDAEVGRFKPHPRGLEVTARRLGVDPRDVLYVGDRPETDAAAAAAAGMACAILGGGRPRKHERWLAVSGYRALADAMLAA